jgi:hypothetical protein
MSRVVWRVGFSLQSEEESGRGSGLSKEHRMS